MLPKSPYPWQSTQRFPPAASLSVLMKFRDVSCQVIMPFDLLSAMGTFLPFTLVDRTLVTVEISSGAKADSQPATSVVIASIPFRVATFMLAVYTESARWCREIGRWDIEHTQVLGPFCRHGDIGHMDK